MRIGIRLLPLTLFMCCLVLISKTGEVIQGGSEVAALLGVSRVEAADEKAKDSEKESSKDKGKDKDKKTEKDKKTDKESSKDGEKSEEDGHAKEDGSEEEGHGEKKEKKEKEEPKNYSETPPADDGMISGIRMNDRRFSPVELDLLQQLAHRREQIDERERSVALKDSVFAATEQRIDQKLEQMQALKGELDKMIVQYKDEENSRIKSLVKIYENMKPKDAARIFDEVEMPILLLVIDQMNEKRVSPILASMDAKKAKQLTVELAEMRKVNSSKLDPNTGKPPAAQPPAPAAPAAAQPPAGGR